jgi:hypothetical protein
MDGKLRRLLNYESRDTTSCWFMKTISWMRFRILVSQFRLVDLVIAKHSAAIGLSPQLAQKDVTFQKGSEGEGAGPVQKGLPMAARARGIRDL